MKTPTKTIDHHTGQIAEDIHRQGTEARRNLLLTPFLLSIPVIIILFILISGTTTDFSSTVNTEPIQREVVTIPIKTPEHLNTAVIKADSAINSSKSIALPTSK